MVVLSASALTTASLLARQEITSLISRYPVLAKSMPMNTTKFRPRSLLLDVSAEAITERLKLSGRLSEDDTVKLTPAVRWCTDSILRLVFEKSSDLQRWKTNFGLHKSNLEFCSPITPTINDPSLRVLLRELQKQLIRVNSDVRYNDVM